MSFKRRCLPSKFLDEFWQDLWPLMRLMDPLRFRRSILKTLTCRKSRSIPDRRLFPMFSTNLTTPATILCVHTTIPRLVGQHLKFLKNAIQFPKNNIQDGLRLANTIETNGISPHHFKNGWAIYVFVLAPDYNAEGFDLIRAGTTSITVRFNPKTTEGINMVVYGDFDSLLLLDKNRQITSDQSL